MISALRSAFGIVVAVAVTTLFTSTASATVTFDWVTVGNPGNAADPTTGLGAVANEYRIATTEVTNGQYVEFLNAVAASDPNGLYIAGMTGSNRGGIIRSGVSGSFTYAPKADFANKPVNLVSIFDVMRFTNWLHNGQGAGGTETGVYTITDGLSETRAAGASYFLPNVDEWYKAAFHQPAAQGGDSDDYWLYATASNSTPTIATANLVGDIANPGTNVVNYANGAVWNGISNVTTVGSAGPGSASFYGTFDQSGNVREFNETLFTSITRMSRGGAFPQNSTALESSWVIGVPKLGQNTLLGFRVASPVPEPASVALIAAGAPLLLRRRAQ